jgi:predicted P-loop ATPase
MAGNASFDATGEVRPETGATVVRFPAIGPLATIKSLVDQGLALHWLGERSKSPIRKEWSTAPVNSYADLQRTYRADQNVGVRLGRPSVVGGAYLYLIDLDIRDSALAAEARAKLCELIPEIETFPTVASGSGGASRHYYFTSDGVFTSKKLAHSTEKFQDAAGKWHWKWEIELFGTGKQAVIPPSIHPDTGKPYRWEREIEGDLIDGSPVMPLLPADFVGKLAPEAAEDDADEDDLSTYLHKQPMDLTLQEVKDTLRDLPLDEWCHDRDGWLNVGMALHHQFQGSDEGLALWNSFSKQSPKFDERDQARVWKSFKVTSKSLRFAVLLKAAADARLAASLAGGALGDGMDTDDDLFGFAADEDDLTETRKLPLDWISRLDRNNETGVLKPTLHNAELIVRNDPRLVGLVRLNDFTQEIVQRRAPGKLEPQKKLPKGVVQLEGSIWKLDDATNGTLWTDSKEDAVRAMIEAPQRQGGYGIKISDRDLKAAVNIVAHDTSFHPVREYLSKLKWDGKKRLDTLFVRHLGAPDGAYSRSVARLTLVAAVTRVFEAGHKFDFAVILEGIQGKRKTTFIETLAHGWFGELADTFDDRNRMVESMQGAWILEIPELSGFGRADVRQIKAFISGKADKVRLAYERRAKVYKRQCVMIGSTNDRNYLRDDTGGRRFWPIECRVGSIDIEAFGREVDQVWAEAYTVYQEMRAAQPYGDLPLYLTDEAAATEAALLQEDRRVETAEDAMAGQFSHWLDGGNEGDLGFNDEICRPRRNETCLLELWVECLGREKATYGQMHAQLLGRAMLRLPNWVKGPVSLTRSFGKQRIYRRRVGH